MKSFVEKFAKNVLSKDEMKDLKGGNQLQEGACPASSCLNDDDCVYAGCKTCTANSCS